jgi:hypothetical protein
VHPYICKAYNNFTHAKIYYLSKIIGIPNADAKIVSVNKIVPNILHKHLLKYRLNDKLDVSMLQ